MNDMTPKQATAWVQQEIARTQAKGPEAIRARIASLEARMQRPANLGLEQSYEANRRLLAALKTETHRG